MHDGTHPIVVERLLEADLRLDSAHTGNVVRCRILHDEEVAGLMGRGLPFHRPFRSRDACGKRIGVRLERRQTRPGLLRERHDRIEVGGLDSANDDHRRTPG